MNKSSKKAGPRHSLRDRILAQILIVIMAITMLPNQPLPVRAASTQTVKSVGSVQTEYEVENGTSKDDIGLPSSLSAVIETTTTAEDDTDGETTTSEETVDKAVSWEGNYDGNEAGTYALTAKFVDSSLSYGSMPTVHVTVREKETASEDAPRAEGGNEETEDGEDDGESEEPAKNQDEPAAEEKEEATEEGGTEEEPAGPQKAPHVTNREKSSLNEFGEFMKVTYTRLDGSPVTDENPLKAGDEFILTLEFDEESGGIQFDMDTLYYTMPSGVTCLSTHTGESTVTLLLANDDKLYLTSTFTVDKESTPNRIIYPWSQEPYDTYDQLCYAENIHLTISTRMMVGENGGEFTFEDGTELPVDLTVGLSVIKENQVNGSYTLTAADKEDMVFAIFDANGSRAKDADGNEIPEFTYADMEAQGANQAKKDFSNLPAGTYKVKEISTLAIPDYTFSSASVTEVTDEKGNVLQEKKNVKNKIAFDKITYTLDNMDRDDYGFVKDTVYKYTVSEVDEGADGVTYDKSIYGLTVTLHDNKDGTINVKVEDGSVHMINLIEIGTGTFRFVEVKAPNGYHLAKSIEFTMSEDGEFSSKYEHIFDKNGNAIFIMEDSKVTKTGDEAPLATAVGGFAVGLAGLTAILAQRKKRRS